LFFFLFILSVQTAIYTIIPEVLLCLKDSNRKTREAAYQLLIAMATKGDIVEYVKVTIAALGSETSQMRSAVVMALSRLVFEQGWANDEFHALLPSLLQTVLVLIHDGSREVIKSVVGFVRICVAAIPSDQLEPLIPDLVGSLLKSQHAKSRFRAKIKIILKKLVKLYGYDALMPHVPKNETRLLSHIRKLDEREKRKKLAARNDVGAVTGGMQNGRNDDYDAMFDSDEDDSDDGRTLMTGATGLLTRRTKMADTEQSVTSKRSKGTIATSMTKGTSKSKISINPNFRLPNETDGEIVDLLSSNITKHVQSYNHDNSDDDDDDDDDSSAEMIFDDDGKLIVQDDDDDDDRKSTTVEMDEIIPMHNNKRRRLMSSSAASFVSNTSKRNVSHGPDNAKINTATTKKKKTSVIGIGVSYQSKKAGGDVKKKGQVYEPYAYVPLDGRSYTKKHRRNAIEQMTTVVNRNQQKQKRTGTKKKSTNHNQQPSNNKRKR
jgi:ribosomal RNA-processing protein 12